jgi:hypothetical protein
MFQKNHAKTCRTAPGQAQPGRTDSKMFQKTTPEHSSPSQATPSLDLPGRTT